jgi:hypothetical protein
MFAGSLYITGGGKKVGVQKRNWKKELNGEEE